MRAQAPDAAACDRCHAPLRALLPASDPVVADGVTCEVCHRLSSATPTANGGSIALELGGKRMRGTICDAAAPYFHRVACAPELGAADTCGACHWLEAPVPTFTTFSEWRHGASGGAAPCQSCHMNGRPGPVASGGPERPRVPDHGPSQAGVAVDWNMSARTGSREVRVAVELRNAGAAHAVPAGLPGRALVVRAEVRDSKGMSLGTSEKSLRRLLVDAAGEEAPFFAAAREAEDTRLREGEARELLFEFRGLQAGEIRVEVTLGLRPLSPALAARLGLPAPELTTLRTGSLNLTVQP
jgi:hypothetical protein